MASFISLKGSKKYLGDKFGYMSFISVSLTIVNELKDKLSGKKKLMLSAFGVGMAWATAVVPFVDTKISDIIEVEDGRAIG